MQFVKRIMVIFVAVGLAACGSIDLSKVVSNRPQPQPQPQPPAQPMPVPAPPAPVQLPSPPVASVPSIPFARDLQAYRQQVGRKINEANGHMTFGGKLPDPMASIPVIEITLNADGSIKELDVRRAPRFLPQTAQMAMDAIRRAAPFGPISNLPQPWVFNETFLFNDDLKFQLLSLQP